MDTGRTTIATTGRDETYSQRTDDADETDDGTDGRTEDDDGDGTDTKERTDDYKLAGKTLGPKCYW